MSTTSQVKTFSDLEKFCSKCGETKSRTEFNKCNQNKDKLFTWCRECQKIYAHSYKRLSKQTSAQIRKTNLRKCHGLTLEQYAEMLKQQNERCAICGSTDTGANTNNFAVDHNHETGKIRGLLCKPCNLALGLFKDAETILLKAVYYLQDTN